VKLHNDFLNLSNSINNILLRRDESTLPSNTTMITADVFKMNIHKEPLEKVLKLYETDDAKGLSQHQSTKRLKADYGHGSNWEEKNTYEIKPPHEN
jgi:hypothetical protein